MRSRFPLGAGDGSNLTNRVLAATGCEETHILTSNEMPSHTHTINDPGHVHLNSTRTGTQDIVAVSGSGVTAADKGYESTTINKTGITINSTVVDKHIIQCLHLLY